jgi:TolB protein
MRAALLGLCALATHTATAHAQAPAASAVDKPPNPDDLLGNVVVVAGAGRPLPKIAVLPSLAADLEDVTIRSVVRRDLDLCGEFEVLADSAAPEGLYLSDSAVDVKAWAAKGVEAVVKVTGKHVSEAKAELRAQAFFVNRGATPVFERTATIRPTDTRIESHRLADQVIGALTGQNGSFASHMIFASGSGKAKRVFTIDADGNDAKAISLQDRMAIAGAFGPRGAPFYTASANHGEFGLIGADGTPVPAPIKGSVYNIAFSKDHTQVALSIGVGDTVKVFLGKDIPSAQSASTIGMALDPAFTPSGKLAFAGEGRFGQRIYVDNKPISPDGLMASSPTFCNHPDGVRAVFAVGVGRDTDLVATGENGGQLVRLTQNQGRNGSPACSPDGRLVAFFSTRTSNEGPGLYVMRLDGGRPKRVSTLLGDALRWDALPK